MRQSTTRCSLPLCRVRAVPDMSLATFWYFLGFWGVGRDKACPGGANLQVSAGVICHRVGQPVAPMGQVDARRTCVTDNQLWMTTVQVHQAAPPLNRLFPSILWITMASSFLLICPRPNALSQACFLLFVNL